MSTVKFMRNYLNNHRNYESFTCTVDGRRLTDDLLAKVPPVGLLSDIAVRETKLNEKEKLIADNAFSAYCMYQTVKILGRNIPDDMMNYNNLVLEAMKDAKKCSEQGTFDKFQKHLTTLVYWRYTDELRKKAIRVKDEETSEQNGTKVYKWQAKMTPMEYEKDDDHSTVMSANVQNSIAEISLEKADKAENIQLVRETLNFCKQTGRLTPEQIDILCHYYGIGKNYEMMNQTEIAEKLGVSPAYVCNRLKDAYEVMRNFIEDDRSAA